ncbi:MAG: hypothetical protein IH626_17595 [Rhodospirillales bacterium]|nr:hypothetical protein [Rhodospirillales bacterium]
MTFTNRPHIVTPRSDIANCAGKSSGKLLEFLTPSLQACHGLTVIAPYFRAVDVVVGDPHPNTYLVQILQDFFATATNFDSLVSARGGFFQIRSGLKFFEVEAHPRN